MAPTPSDKLKKNWSQINRLRKEEKKKWKEINLTKKIEKHTKRQENNTTNEPVEVNNVVAIEKGNASNNNSIPTLSIAVPGSILENAQSQELQTYLAGQIARAACIFQVDEIIVFDDYGDEANSKKSTFEHDSGIISARQSCVKLGRILQYLECPQYLRKHFFPIHQDLKLCGILNPLNAPHHLKPNDNFTFREGVVTNKLVKGDGSYVHIGLLKDVQVDKSLTSGLRCTVRLLPQQENTKKMKGVIVSPSVPRKETGIYWGYSVRIATSLSKVFSQSPYHDGYDLTLGTSDKGTSVDEFDCPSYNHLLIVFGGLQGLEAALESDPVLNVEDPGMLFDHYLNTLPNQGSKTIRTEEAILVSLAALRPMLHLGKLSCTVNPD